MNMPLIFLDSGNPKETEAIRKELGFLDGQTTNPTLIANNPKITEYRNKGKMLSSEELFSEYKAIIIEIQKHCKGPISVEVYADWGSKPEELLRQAEEIRTWGDNIYVKFPAINAGLEAAHRFVASGGSVNMTLVFDQKQAAAVYSATIGATTPTFVSPFIARWKDRGYEGIDFLRNVVDMYTEFDSELKLMKPHIKVLAASIRTVSQFYLAAQAGADIITLPAKTIRDWIAEGKPNPMTTPAVPASQLQSIPYEYIPFEKNYKKYSITKVHGSLLDEGLRKFIKDWRSVAV